MAEPREREREKDGVVEKMAASDVIEVTGAYGRTYNALKDAVRDWENGKDFRMTTGGYIGRCEAEQYGLTVVVRYGRDGARIGSLRIGTRAN